MKMNWKGVFKTLKERRGDVILAVGLLVSLLAVALGIESCTVTRTITNESQYLQKGDTSVVIQTKTIESYNGQKH